MYYFFEIHKTDFIPSLKYEIDIQLEKMFQSSIFLSFNEFIVRLSFVQRN